MRGELAEPLPPTRAWSEQLGVGRPTLRRALRTLHREGILSIHARGSRILRGRGKKLESARPLVRLLYYGPDFPSVSHSMIWIAPLAERLHLHGIQLGVERCNAARLNSILHEKSRREELFFLLGFRPKYHQLFKQCRKPSIILGEPAAHVSLPFITDDQDGVVRHATQTLLRHGFARLSLLLPEIVAPGILSATATFRSACAAWPHQPVRGQVCPTSLHFSLQESAAKRFAANLRGREGVIVVAPISLTLIMTTILAQGIAIPQQVKLAAVLHPPESVQVNPRPLHYWVSLPRGVKAMADAAIHYFETGSVPNVSKRLSVELIGGQ